jgi:hypothetical protein
MLKCPTRFALVMPRDSVVLGIIKVKGEPCLLVDADVEAPVEERYFCGYEVGAPLPSDDLSLRYVGAFTLSDDNVTFALFERNKPVKKADTHDLEWWDKFLDGMLDKRKPKDDKTDTAGTADA